MENLSKIKVLGTWYTRRYTLEQESVASYKLEWREHKEKCVGEAYYGEQTID